MSAKFQVFSLSEPDGRVREQKKRQAHKKTKSGCLPCKVKRVKCDQVKPHCLRCQRRSHPCNYGSGDAAAVAHLHGRRPAVGRSLELLPFDLGDESGPQHGTSTAELLHHFQHNWAAIFGLPNGGPIVSLCHGRPFLRDGMFAVAACHLRHHVRNPRDHRLAETFRQSLAIRGFQDAISTPLATLSVPEVKLIVLAASLLNMLVFALPTDEDPDPASRQDPDPSKSWVFSTRPDRLDWLGVQLGLKPLILEADSSGRACESLRSVFENSDDEVGNFTCEGRPLTGVPDAWLSLFGIPRREPPPGSACDCRRRQSSPRDKVTNVPPEELGEFQYREPLRLLALLVNTEPLLGNFYRFVQVVAKVEPEFRARLYERDEKALWVFGYWLGLMCRYRSLWWCGRRVWRDFTAVVIWLRSSGLTERPGRQGKLWEQMLIDLEDSVNWPPSDSVISPELRRDRGIAVPEPLNAGTAVAAGCNIPISLGTYSS